MFALHVVTPHPAPQANQLKEKMRKLELARETDLRDDNEAAAAAKAEEMRVLQAEIDVASDPKNKANRDRQITLDFSVRADAVGLVA